MTVTYHAGRRIQGTSTDVAEFYCGETPVIDGSDTVITFLQDGKFIPTSSFDIEYLVVAGGGQGGQSNAGGGGAGGYLANNSKSHGVTAQDYTITVGGKGTSAGSISQRGTAGENSSIVPTSGTSFIAIGGGGGGSEQADPETGGNGGSGGGGNGYAGQQNASNGLGGTGTSGQGNAGGNGSSGGGAAWRGGGGGGSASAGANGSVSGNGGNGTQNDISGTNTYYSAGGGGGCYTGTAGSGGTGGGGNGSQTGVGGHATTYGSGGGGSDNGGGSNAGGNGGDGIVIIRFATSGNTYQIAGKPTNVQEGSRFEETDTRKMYNFKHNGTSELKAYYNMEQTSGNLINQQTTGDGLGSNADGINTNVTQNSTGKVGTYSYSYNGTTSSSKTLLGSSTSQFNFLHADQATVSVNIWYKKTSVDTNFRTIIASTAAGAQNGFRMAFSGTNSLRVEIYNNGNNLVNSPHSSSSAIIPSNTDWHMLTVTVDRTLSSDNLIVYIDGSSVYTADKTSNSGTSSNAQFAMAIGDDQGGDGNMNGNFDELSIWNKVLTSDEITTLYNSGSGLVITDDMSTIWQEIGT